MITEIEKCPHHVRRWRGCPICERILANLEEWAKKATPKPVKLVCKSCDGTGRRSTSEAESKVLEVLQAIAIATCADIHRIIGGKLDAVHQQVRRLLAIHAIERVGMDEPKNYRIKL